MNLGKPTDGPISRYINRKISMPISKFIVNKFGDVSPNKVTILTTIFGIFAGLIYLFEEPIIAGICVQIASIVDGVDGEVARLLNKQSNFGAFLDSVMDRIVDITILTCFSIFIWRTYMGPLSQEVLILIMLMAISGSIMVSYSRSRCESALGIDTRNLAGFPLASRDVRLFIIFIGSVVGLYVATLVALTFLTYVHIAIDLWLVKNYVNRNEAGKQNGPTIRN